MDDPSMRRPGPGGSRRRRPTPVPLRAGLAVPYLGVAWLFGGKVGALFGVLAVVIWAAGGYGSRFLWPAGLGLMVLTAIVATVSNVTGGAASIAAVAHHLAPHVLAGSAVAAVGLAALSDVANLGRIDAVARPPDPGDAAG
jgi:hypothetical protein